MAGVCEEECVGRHPGDEALTLTRRHSYMKPLKDKICLWHKGENFLLFLSFSFTDALLSLMMRADPAVAGSS